MNEKLGITSDPPAPPGIPLYSHEPRLGTLNLVLGGVAFAVAAAMAGASLRLAGSQTLVGIVAAITTAVAFLILWNLRIHRQPHGMFLCSSLLCLGGAAVALGHALYVGDLVRVESKLGGEPKVMTGGQLPLATWQAPPAGPPPATSRPRGGVASAGPTAREPEELPEEIVSTPKTPEWTAEWKNSQAEAMRRYPTLAIRDSRENKTFMSAYQSLKKSNPGYFDEPDWPLTLALALAERDGWERGDGIMDERPMGSSPPSTDTPGSGSEDR